MEIRNCRFKFKCTKTWDSLVATSDQGIKYCHECDRGVHYCNNESELDHALRQDWCVALILTDEDDPDILYQTIGVL